jgi:hypothetical protein
MRARIDETGDFTGLPHVTAIDQLLNVVGLYVVTADGKLGVYGEDKRFVADQALTQALAPQIRQLVSAYLASPDASEYRLGVVYHGAGPHPWESDTLALEEAVLREVYPVSGPTTQGLTAFQKKNRDKSIYRGIELLLEYRYERIREEPVYCPVLFDRGTTLDEYHEYGTSKGTPILVMEVLNLIAHVPLGRRDSEVLRTLMSNMHRYLVHKDMRRAGLFTLNEERFVGAADGAPTTVEFFDADKRHDRQQTLVGGTLHQRLLAAEQAQLNERFAQVEQWLERPHRPVDPALLRTFTQFRNLDGHVLSVLAEKALVHTAPSNARLINIGMKDAWNMYLLEGTVSLQAADGGAIFVTGGGDKAASPISFLKPRKYTVTAVTSTSFLWIHDALLAAIAVAPPPEMSVAPSLKPFRS